MASIRIRTFSADLKDVPFRLVNSVVARRRVVMAVRHVVKRLDPSVLNSLWDGQNLGGHRLHAGAKSLHVLDELLPGWLESDLVVADVGSRWGVVDRWRTFQPHVRVVGFDPDEAECQRLMALEGSDGVVSFVPAALGPRNGTAILYLTRSPACSSLYPPDEDLIRARPRLTSMAPVGTSSVPLTTLDDWYRESGHDHVDVIKLDTQGSELGVLEGATEALATTRLIEVEVEFNEMYSGQPLFNDVDRFLRSRDFVLWRLKGLMHYGIDGIPASAFEVDDKQYFDGTAAGLEAQGGQLFWAHAYFVRREMAFPDEHAKDWQQAVRDACSAQAFGFTDLALAVLRAVRPVAPDSVGAELDRLFRA